MKQHILLVDDEEAIRYPMQRILDAAGYKISSASNGAIALDITQELEKSEDKVSLVVTDICMPVMDGMEMIDEIRKLERRIPVLAVTGFGDKKVIVELMRKGVDEFLDKPFKAGELLDKVSQVFVKEEEKLKKEKAQLRKMEEEKDILSQGLSSYRRSYEKLLGQVSSAKDAYSNLVFVKKEGYKVKMDFKMKPLMDLGGDFFDMRDTPTGCDVFLADVSGHDMGASYNTVLLKAFFEENCRTENDGPTFFRMLNEQMLKTNNTPRMTTATFVRFNLETKQAEFVSAGHPPACILRKKFPMVRPCEAEGPILGIFPEMKYECKVINFEEGDRFILYTDGLPRAKRFSRNTGSKIELTEPGIDDFILKHRGLSLEEMIHSLWEDVMDWSNQQPNDDMLLLGIEV